MSVTSRVQAFLQRAKKLTQGETKEEISSQSPEWTGQITEQENKINEGQIERIQVERSKIKPEPEIGSLRNLALKFQKTTMRKSATVGNLVKQEEKEVQTVQNKSSKKIKFKDNSYQIKRIVEMFEESSKKHHQQNQTYMKIDNKQLKPIFKILENERAKLEARPDPNMQIYKQKTENLANLVKDQARNMAQKLVNSQKENAQLKKKVPGFMKVNDRIVKEAGSEGVQGMDIDLIDQFSYGKSLENVFEGSQFENNISGICFSIVQEQAMRKGVKVIDQSGFIEQLQQKIRSLEKELEQRGIQVEQKQTENLILETSGEDKRGGMDEQEEKKIQEEFKADLEVKIQEPEEKTIQEAPTEKMEVNIQEYKENQIQEVFVTDQLEKIQQQEEKKIQEALDIGQQEEVKEQKENQIQEALITDQQVEIQEQTQNKPIENLDFTVKEQKQIQDSPIQKLQEQLQERIQIQKLHPEDEQLKIQHQAHQSQNQQEFNPQNQNEIKALQDNQNHINTEIPQLDQTSVISQSIQEQAQQILDSIYEEIIIKLTKSF